MIYLEEHKERIRKELESFVANRITNDNITYAFMHSEFPNKIFEEIAINIETIFKSFLLEFVMQYAEENDFSFVQLKEILK